MPRRQRTARTAPGSPGRTTSCITPWPPCLSPDKISWISPKIRLRICSRGSVSTSGCAQEGSVRLSGAHGGEDAQRWLQAPPALQFLLGKPLTLLYPGTATPVIPIPLSLCCQSLSRAGSLGRPGASRTTSSRTSGCGSLEDPRIACSARSNVGSTLLPAPSDPRPSPSFPRPLPRQSYRHVPSFEGPHRDCALEGELQHAVARCAHIPHMLTHTFAQLTHQYPSVPTSTHQHPPLPRSRFRPFYSCTHRRAQLARVHEPFLKDFANSIQHDLPRLRVRVTRQRSAVGGRRRQPRPTLLSLFPLPPPELPQEGRPVTDPLSLPEPHADFFPPLLYPLPTLPTHRSPPCTRPSPLAPSPRPSPPTRPARSCASSPRASQKRTGSQWRGSWWRSCSRIRYGCGILFDYSSSRVRIVFDKRSIRPRRSRSPLTPPQAWEDGTRSSKGHIVAEQLGSDNQPMDFKYEGLLAETARRANSPRAQFGTPGVGRWQGGSESGPRPGVIVVGDPGRQIPDTAAAASSCVSFSADFRAHADAAQAAVPPGLLLRHSAGAPAHPPARPPAVSCAALCRRASPPL